MGMDYRFTIGVPFEPILHESLESASSSVLPLATVGGFDITAADGAYLATLEEVAAEPSAAMRAAAARVEDLLNVLAVWNDAFHIRYVGIRVLETVPVTHDLSLIVQDGTVTANDHLFLTDHLGTVKTRDSLEREAAVLETRDGWPPYVRSALELNYLAVSSEHLRTRFLLTMIALESLASGRLGPVVGLLDGRDDSAELRSAIGDVLTRREIPSDARERLLNRLFATTVRSPIDHICTYLEKIEVGGWDRADVKRWWTARGALAHGGGGDVDDTMLSLLRSRTQEALRREVHL
jgi:hypothetical protein